MQCFGGNTKWPMMPESEDADEGVFEQGDGPLPDEPIIRAKSMDSPFYPIQGSATSNDIYDRQMVVKVLQQVFKTAPAEPLAADLPKIMKTVADLAEDRAAVVRVDLLEHIPNLVATANECTSRVPELANVLSEYFLPMVLRNLDNSNGQVKQTAQSTLCVLVEKGLVNKLQAEIQVCPAVLALTSTEGSMECYKEAVTLMSRLAPCLGREVTERVFLDRFIQLCGDERIYLRRICASHFGDFCAIIGKEAYEKLLLPCYIDLCGDETWGVRKICAEVVMPVSCACPPFRRRLVLAPVFAQLLQDKSRWVRMSAFQTLGPFISTFADPTVTNLAYNSIGELVLINNSGTEFRLTPTLSSNNLSDLGMLANLHLNDVRDPDDVLAEYLGEFEGSSDVESRDEDDDIIFNPLSELENDSPDCKEVRIDNVALELEVATEETASEESSQVTAKAEVDEKVTFDEADTNCNMTYPDDINEIVKSVKNAVLNFRYNESDSNQKPCDNLAKYFSQGLFSEPITYKDLLNNEEHCYSLDRNLNIKAASCDNTATTAADENCQSCSIELTQNKPEDLNQFNSYNYWYISPEMPLDPGIINAETCRNSVERKEKEALTVFVSSKLRKDKKNSISSHSTFKEKVAVADQPSSLFKSDKFELQSKKAESLCDIVVTEPSQYIVPQQLIDHFVSMTDPNLAHSTDNEIAYLCAYSLPAVALTLGSKNWHLLKDTVEVLAANLQYKVRRTVASSLHELAVIWGPDIATNNLTPIFEGFIKDLDEVRIGVLKHLAHFLRLISPAKRNVYLPKLADFLQRDNEANWRFRHELAEQLLLAVPLFRPVDAWKHITKPAQELLCDKVAAVREIALLLVRELVRHVSSDQALTSRLLVKLAERFAHSKRWKRRQSFAMLCSELLLAQALSSEQFASEVMPHLLDLSWDPVANVRLVVARTISQNIITNDYFMDTSNQHYDGLQTVLRRLQSDKDRDVRQLATIQKSPPTTD